MLINILAQQTCKGPNRQAQENNQNQKIFIDDY